MTERAKLLKEIEGFLARHRMAPSTFGRLAMGDPSFMSTLKNNQRGVKIDTVDKLRKWMAGYRAKPRPTSGAGRASKAA